MQIKHAGLAILLLLTLAACGGGGSGSSNNPPPAKGANFVTFETGQVRPLALSPDGSRLFALNTPNGSLEIFSLSVAGISHESSVPVGMEPTAVTALTDSEVWVVNHLSDSVSIVDVSTNPPRVTRTLLVGDEPRDIVFANGFAFITTAHRGQNSPYHNSINEELTTPGKDRADVWVFDTSAVGTGLGGDPVNVITLFGDTPRALSVSPDGNTVYAAVFLSGNRTTTMGENNLNKTTPTSSSDGIAAPDTGLIVQFDGTDWVDDAGRTGDGSVTYNDEVRFSLPDYDVFTIDATQSPPVKTSTQYSGVGTTLFNMATNPQSGVIYVSNTEALNLTRFEGPGIAASTVRGHFTESRISVIDGAVVTPCHLNGHINHSQFPGNQAERDNALAQPMDMTISSDGNTLFVSAFASQKIGVYSTQGNQGIKSGSCSPTASAQIALTAGGPSGVALDEANKRLYVLTRFDNGISTIDTGANTEIAHTTLYNPEPEHVVAGRPFLYDAANTSSHGDSSCGLCHVFGDFDGLAWDLGNPDDVVAINPNAFVNPQLRPVAPVFHPMKGPMGTQSLRGLKGNGPMHWRGDRIGASSGDSLELRAFKDFNVAFPGLVGSDTELADADMEAFAKFALEITYPPNPIRNLDNSLTSKQESGKNIYMQDITTGPGTFTCNFCHVLDPENGHFGTAGLSTIEGPDVSQEFKVPHLRNMYQKVGKFGHSGKFATDTNNYGEQIKGFGFMHDGGMDTLNNFFQGQVFKFNDDPTLNDIFRSNVIDFVMAMDSELAPIVGQQITLTDNSDPDVAIRIDLLRARGQVTSPRAECDLIVKGVINGEARGYLMQADGSYQSDRANEHLTHAQLTALATGSQTLTFTCVPPGSGTWMGIDHDEDGHYDRDELDKGTNPFGV